MKGEIISTYVQPEYVFKPFKVQLTFTSPIEAIDFYVRTNVCPSKLASMFRDNDEKKRKKGKKKSFKKTITDRFIELAFATFEDEYGDELEGVEEFDLKQSYDTYEVIWKHIEEVLEGIKWDNMEVLNRQEHID